MKSDGVSVAFSIIMDEIQAVVEQLNHEGVNAFKNSKYSDAEKLSESGKELDAFRLKLEQLKNEWNSGIDVATRERVKVEQTYSIRPHSKSRKTVLRITLENGRIIQRPVAAQSFVDTIEQFGIEKVKALGHTINGIDLISTEKSEKYGQTESSGFYICTHSNTQSKKKLLLKIAEELVKNIKVEIIKNV